MKKILALSVISTLLLLCVSTPSFAVVSLSFNDFSTSKLTDNSGDGWAVAGASHGPAANGGYSMSMFGTEAASSSASWLWPFGWWDYSIGQVWLHGNLYLDVVGEPGESAEIIADWSFLSGPVLTAYPSGMKPSSTTASGYSNMNFLVVGTNQDGFVYEYIPFSDEQTVIWMGASGDVEKESGQLSLGIFEVGGPTIYIHGGFYAYAEAYSNPFGSAAANLFSTANIKLTPRTLDPSIVPEPATFSLLGLGALGLLFKKKRTV